MFKGFLLTALAALVLASPAAPAQISGTGHVMAAFPADMIEIASPKQKAFKISKTKKRISSRFTRRQCWSDTDSSVCKLCRPGFDGFCRCEQHFPCE